MRRQASTNLRTKSSFDRARCASSRSRSAEFTRRTAREGSESAVSSRGTSTSSDRVIRAHGPAARAAGRKCCRPAPFAEQPNRLIQAQRASRDDHRSRRPGGAGLEGLHGQAKARSGPSGPPPPRSPSQTIH